MEDKEKFEGFKQRTLSENEEKYGQEVREKFGDSVVDKANQKFSNMTAQEYGEVTELTEMVNQALADAVRSADVEGPEAQRLCELHAKWLTYFWPEGMYTPEAHLSLAQTYTLDDRFKRYYEAIAPGGAEFLYEALQSYLPSR